MGQEIGNRKSEQGTEECHECCHHQGTAKKQQMNGILIRLQLDRPIRGQTKINRLQIETWRKRRRNNLHRPPDIGFAPFAIQSD